jgi:hypothetical protein
MAIDMTQLAGMTQEQALDYLRQRVDPTLRPRVYSESGGEGGGYAYSDPYAYLTPNFDPTYAGGVYGRYGVDAEGNVRFIKGERSGSFFEENIDTLGPLIVGGAALAGGLGFLGGGAGAGAGAASAGGISPGIMAGLETAVPTAAAPMGGSIMAAAPSAAGAAIPAAGVTGSLPSLTGAAALEGATLPVVGSAAASAAPGILGSAGSLFGGQSWLTAGLQLASGLLQSSAAGRAAGAQAGAAQAGIDEQRRQFDALQQILAPYTQAGVPAIRQMQALSGALGPQAEQEAIAQIEASPTLQAATRRGEEALLQRASATGGLRGGNIQAALAQFRPQMLAQEIQSRLGQFGGLATLGGNAAARVGSGGQAVATNIGNLLQQQGAAQAGGVLGQSAPFANLLALPSQLAATQAVLEASRSGSGRVF